MANKGEWSELYVLIELLSTGKLYLGDSTLQRLTAYLPVLAISRKDKKDKSLEYRRNNSDNSVEIYENNKKVRDIQDQVLKAYASKILSGIKSGSKSSFDIPDAAEIMNDLDVEKISAPGSDKADIKITIYDPKTGSSSLVGYSIKSDLGDSPTLLNASKQTNFVYEVSGLSDNIVKEINGIDTKSKIRDRINSIESNGGTINFAKTDSDIFSGNLKLIDSLMPEILSKMLLIYYKTGLKSCSEVADILEQEDPLSYNRSGIYRYKIKKLLCAVALGMMPGKDWSGYDEANGGYIIVTKSGTIVAFHLYNRNEFEDYLINNTRFETASSSRHDFGTIYEASSKKYIKLNLQIRFDN